jgi:hypothetical protein
MVAIFICAWCVDLAQIPIQNFPIGELQFVAGEDIVDMRAERWMRKTA